MLKALIRTILLICIAVIVACANPPIVKIGDNTYLLSKEDHAGIFGSMSKLKAKVINEANTFAEKQDKVAVPISVREKPVGMKPADWATFEYQFKLVDKDSEEAKNASFSGIREDLPVRPDQTILTTGKISANVTTESKETTVTTSTPDLYSELLKLDDLRERGILTDEEFQAQKEKLLKVE